MNVIFFVDGGIICWKVRHAERWVYRLGPFDRWLIGSENRLSSPQTVPFHNFILTNGFHCIVVHLLDFFSLTHRASLANGP